MIAKIRFWFVICWIRVFFILKSLWDLSTGSGWH